ncbi:MAG TPA: ABC transporter substrate-binding protein [Solirubrobacteraceae bacterium]|nr:ABC transporter substrate-binding protein [Solirubrobacteraceae bacterium]
MSDTAYGLRRRELLQRAGAGGVLLASGSLLSACGLSEDDSGGGGGGTTLKIGYIRPQTGPLAGFNEGDPYVLSLVREAYRKGITGGDGKKYTVQIVAKDAASDQARAAEVARQAMLEDKVDLIITGGTPTIGNPVSDQAEAQGVPHIVTLNPWESWFMGRGGTKDKGFRYGALFFPGGSVEVEGVPPVFEQMGEQSGNQTIGALWPNNVDGDTFREVFTPAIKEIGYELVDPGPYAEPSQNYSTQIGRFRQGDAGILTGCPDTPNFATFWRQARQSGYRPYGAYIHKAILFPAAVESLGDLGENLCTSAWWTPDVPYTSQLNGMTSKEFGDGYEREIGKQWHQPSAFWYAAFEVAAQLIENTPEPKDKDALASTLIKMKGDTLVGPYDFGGGPTPNVHVNPIFPTQWVRGQGKYPFDLNIIDNTLAPDVKVTGELQPLPDARV